MRLQSSDINRDILECKSTAANNAAKAGNDINRDILECKCENMAKGINSMTDINRDILECKSRKWSTRKSAESILIETYWNVNEIVVAVCSLLGTHINRDILECK